MIDIHQMKHENCFVLVILLVVVVGGRCCGNLLTPTMSFMVHQYSIRHELYLGYVFDYEDDSGNAISKLP
jgi:hypothetical protein